MCERWVGDRTELQHIDPPTLLAITAFLSRSPGLLNRGPWGPSLCWDMVLIPASSLQLIWTSYRLGYIIIWRPPTSSERHISHSIQPVDSQGYPPISSTGCTCYLHRCISYFNSSAGANMQQMYRNASHHILMSLVNLQNKNQKVKYIQMTTIQQNSKFLNLSHHLHNVVD